MKNKLISITVLLSMVLLSGLASAAPRVCLVQVLKGKVTIDGKTIKGASLGEQGQSLKLAAGSKVRVQILRASKEVTITGPTTLKIDEKTLASKGKVLARRGLHVVKDIGNPDASGAGLKRKGEQKSEKSRSLEKQSGPHERLGAKVHFKSGTKAAQASVSLPIEESVFYQSDAEKYLHVLGVKIWRVKEDQDFTSKDAWKIDAELEEPKGVQGISLPPDYLKTGYRYLVVVTKIPDGLNSSGDYSRSFRFLSQAEKSLLEQLEWEYRKQSVAESSLDPLIRLAIIYNDMDQVGKAESILAECVKNSSRYPQSAELRKALFRSWNVCRRSLDMDYQADPELLN